MVSCGQLQQPVLRTWFGILVSSSSMTTEVMYRFFLRLSKVPDLDVVQAIMSRLHLRYRVYAACVWTNELGEYLTLPVPLS